MVLVWIDTLDGSRGFAPAGASSSAMREYFSDDSQSSFATLINERIAAELEGERLGSVDDVHSHVDALDLPSRLKNQVASALDIAYYDLRGKEAGAPIYRLLAERTDASPTTTMPLYASGGMYMEPDEFAQQAAIVDRLDFYGYKYRPGIGPERDRETIDRIVQTVTQTEVMADAHTWWKMGQRQDDYDQDTIQELVSYMNNSGAYWIEEPVEPDEYLEYIRLSETGARLAGGESEHSADALLDLADTGAVSFLQGDVRHHQGYTGCWEAVERCEGTNIEFVPHNFGTWLGLVANAHLTAAAPDVKLLEYPLFEGDPVLSTDDGSGDPGMYPFELAFDIIEGEPDVSEGKLSISDDPGLGVDIDLTVLDEYPFIEGPWTEFLYSE